MYIQALVCNTKYTYTCPYKDIYMNIHIYKHSHIRINIHTYINIITHLTNSLSYSAEKCIYQIRHRFKAKDITQNDKS